MNNKMLHILGCPKCKRTLNLDEQENFLICKKCQLKFKIEDDIPILLIDKAKKYSSD